MELKEAILNRRAIRKYKSEPVPREKLEELFDLARWSPIANFLRVYEYYVVSGETRDKVVEAISKNTVHLRDLLERAEEEVKEKALDFYPDLGGAPHIIVITIPYSDDEWERKWFVAVATLELMVLAYSALALGLGTCGVTCSPWVEKKIKEILKIPEEREVFCCVAVGYPDESPEPLPHNRVKVHYID